MHRVGTLTNTTISRMGTNTMANNNASPIAPSDMGRNDLTLVAGTGASQQVAFALAATGDAQGFDIAALRVRLAAVGAPQWSRNVRAGDFNWLARQASKAASARGRVGTLHAYRHDTPKGSPTACDTAHGAGASVCGHTVRSHGDNVRRWAYVGYDVPPTLASVDSTLKAARERLQNVVSTLQAAGFARERIEATEGIATLIALLGAPKFASAKPKRTRTARKATAKATAEANE